MDITLFFSSMSLRFSSGDLGMESGFGSIVMFGMDGKGVNFRGLTAAVRFELRAGSFSAAFAEVGVESSSARAMEG